MQFYIGTNSNWFGFNDMFWIDLDWILLFNWLNWCLTWLEIFNWFQFIGFSHHFLHAIILPDLSPAVCINNCGTICSKKRIHLVFFSAFAPPTDVCRRCDRRAKEFRLCTGQRPRRAPVTSWWWLKNVDHLIQNCMKESHGVKIHQYNFGWIVRAAWRLLFVFHIIFHLLQRRLERGLFFHLAWFGWFPLSSWCPTPKSKSMISLICHRNIYQNCCFLRMKFWTMLM